jgi:thioredoxin reductase
MNEYEVVIIGGGAAGLSAALVLTRARRSVLVVDSGTPRNAPAAHMQGFLSRDGMPPAELLVAGREEVRSYGGSIAAASVAGVAPLDRPGRIAFSVRLGDGTEVHARRILVATGLTDELPDLPGIRERWARDVLHCPYCHGYEVRDQRVGVLWHGPDTVRYTQVVRQWSDDVVLFAPEDALDDSGRQQLLARAIGIVEGAVDEVVADDRLRAVHLADGRSVPRDVLFVPPRFVAHDQLLEQLGCERDAAGWIATGPGGSTTVAGVWAAGNVVNPRAQVISAAGEGSAAAIALNTDLVEEDVALAVTAFAGAG